MQTQRRAIGSGDGSRDFGRLLCYDLSRDDSAEVTCE
jgi:hypothetical protein